MKRWILLTITYVLAAAGCAQTKKMGRAVDRASYQYGQMLGRLTLYGQYPRSQDLSGKLKLVGVSDWTSGFFPGTLWYLYALTGKPEWKENALKHTLPLEAVRHDSSTHDLGFMLYCSFGNALKFSGDSGDIYRKILVDGAEALSSRFSKITGCIRSWDFGEWQFPVIIDNMMNLELLAMATDFTGNQRYIDIARTHAGTTLRNHFRSDHSCYHVLDYDSTNGAVRSKGTFQGFSDASAWSRGQAWALYGYTMMYRFTKDRQWLRQAEAIADFFLSHPDLPADKIPYWDFNAPDIPVAPRDASAAAIVASALVELAQYADKKKYLRNAGEMLASLCREKYLAAEGENNSFLLKHSTGSKPHNSEVDAPLNYADYYFMEAIYRYTNTKKGLPVSW